MDSTRSKFIYGLQALLRKRSAELQRLKEGLAAATSRVIARTRELEACSAQLRELENYQRALSGAGADIDIAARMRLHESLRSGLLQKNDQAALLEQARAHEEKVIDELRGARQALQAVERHRERANAEFRKSQQRQALRAADELYLANRHAQAAGRAGSET